MHKVIKLSKRIIVLLITLLFGIECFAAVVSDNDGAAFITKAEFDSLKNSFQSQINAFNSGIDAKIESSIASYLANVKIEKKESYKIIPGDLTSDVYVNFMNKYIKPEFRLPGLNYDLVTHIWYDVVQGDERYYVIFGNYRVQYNKDWGTNETNRKPLVKLKSGSEGGASNVYYWDGIANRYNETITSTNTKYLHYPTWVGSIDNAGYTHYLALVNPFSFSQYTGSNIINVNMLTNTSVKYTNSHGDNHTVSSWDSQKSIFQLAISLDEYDGAKKDHILISQFDGSTLWDCYNEEFVNYFKTSSFQSLTAKNLFDTVKSNTYKSEYGMFFAANRQHTDQYWVEKNMTWQTSDSETYIPSSGYIGALTASNLYLFKNKIKKTFRDSEWEIDPLTLEKGVPILAAKKDDKIEWDIKFDHVYCFNTTPNTSGTNYNDNQNEVDLYFSYVPFTNGVTTGSAALDNGNLVKFKEGDVEKNFFTTTNRKGKIEFKMKKDSIVYMKAVPHWNSSASYNGLSDWWDLYLNIDGDNGIFKVVYE